MSICNRNRIMTGLRFFFRVTLRRLDLAHEVYDMHGPRVMSPDERRRLLAVAGRLKVRTLLGRGCGCGLRASEMRRGNPSQAHQHWTIVVPSGLQLERNARFPYLRSAFRKRREPST